MSTHNGMQALDRSTNSDMCATQHCQLCIAFLAAIHDCPTASRWHQSPYLACFSNLNFNNSGWMILLLFFFRRGPAAVPPSPSPGCCPWPSPSSWPPAVPSPCQGHGEGGRTVLAAITHQPSSQYCQVKSGVPRAGLSQARLPPRAVRAQAYRAVRYFRAASPLPLNPRLAALREVTPHARGGKRWGMPVSFCVPS